MRADREFLSGNFFPEENNFERYDLNIDGGERQESGEVAKESGTAVIKN